MKDIALQHIDHDFWRLQIKFASQHGYRVLPISAPIEGYMVAHGQTVMAR